MTDQLIKIGLEVLGVIFAALFAYLGAQAKKLAVKWLDNKTKKDLANTVVMFVEQTYKNAHGSEKMSVAMEQFSSLLADKGIAVTVDEMKVLLESAVGSFNDAFNKN